MLKKEKDDHNPFEISHISENPHFKNTAGILRIKRKKLGGKPKEYTCSFCFRKFISPQAMGGHQNAHRKVKRLLATGAIGDGKGGEEEVGSSSNVNHTNSHFHAVPKLVKFLQNDFAKIRSTFPKRLRKSSASNNNNNNNKPFVLMNFLPPKELSLAEKVGVIHAEDAKGKSCVGLDHFGGSEISTSEKLLDLQLTLKL